MLHKFLLYYSSYGIVIKKSLLKFRTATMSGRDLCISGIYICRSCDFGKHGFGASMVVNSGGRGEYQVMALQALCYRENTYVPLQLLVFL